MMCAFLFLFVQNSLEKKGEGETELAMETEEIFSLVCAKP